VSWEDSTERGERLCAFAKDLIYGVKLRCPKCGGDIGRRYSFFEALGLFLPINFRRVSTFSCDNKCVVFRGPRGWGSFILAWVSGASFLLLPSWVFKVVALAIAVTVLVILRAIGKQKVLHPFAVAGMCGALLFFTTAAWVTTIPPQQLPFWLFFALLMLPVLAPIWLGALVCYIDSRMVHPGALKVVGGDAEEGQGKGPSVS